MKIWDLATRLYHWLQAAVFIGLIITGTTGSGPHMQLGLVLFTLVTWRILWGFCGSETNRFKQFLCTPRVILNYLRGRSSQKPGHNPAGGWMVFALLFSLLLQCISGLALAGSLDQLPLAELWLTDNVFSLLESTHLLLADVLPILVFVHVVAVICYKLKQKPLVLAMITGCQSHHSGFKPPYFVSSSRAFLVLVAAGLVTIAIVALSMV